MEMSAVMRMLSEAVMAKFARVRRASLRRAKMEEKGAAVWAVTMIAVTRKGYRG